MDKSSEQEPNFTGNDLQTVKGGINTSLKQYFDDSKWDDKFMGVAVLTAKPNTLGVVCVVDDDKKLVSVGQGIGIGCNNDQTGLKHSVKAILKQLSSDGEKLTLYIALFPCIECVKAIKQSGIKGIVYLCDKPEAVASKQMLDKSGIEYMQLRPSCERIIIDLTGIERESGNPPASAIAEMVRVDLNILHLPDEIIIGILHRLENIEDILNAAKVCTKFQACAKASFPERFKTLIISDQLRPHEIDDSYPCNQLHFDRVESFLSIFGKLIEKIIWSEYKEKCHRRVSTEEIDHPVFDAITKYCAGELKSLTIEQHHVHSQSQSSFHKLEELDMSCYTSGVQPKITPDMGIFTTSKLERLTLSWFEAPMNWNFLEREFPKLIDAELRCCKFTDSVVKSFLEKAPQLRSLLIYECSEITSAIFQNIDTSISGLEQLKFVGGLIGNYIYEDDLIHLTRLKKLKYLSIEAMRMAAFPFQSFVDSLAQDTPIENLTLRSMEGAGDEIVPSLIRLEKLKFMESLTLSDQCLLDLVRESPALEGVFLNSGKEITYPGLEGVIKSARNLKWIRLQFMEASLNYPTYETLLDLAKRHSVRLELPEFESEIEVPKNDQLANKEWIDFDPDWVDPWDLQ